MSSGGIEKDHKRWISLTTPEIPNFTFFCDVLHEEHTYSESYIADSYSKSSAIFIYNKQTAIIGYLINMVQ